MFIRTMFLIHQNHVFHYTVGGFLGIKLSVSHISAEIIINLSAVYKTDMIFILVFIAYASSKDPDEAARPRSLV